MTNITLDEQLTLLRPGKSTDYQVRWRPVRTPKHACIIDGPVYRRDKPGAAQIVYVKQSLSAWSICIGDIETGTAKRLAHTGTHDAQIDALRELRQLAEKFAWREITDELIILTPEEITARYMLNPTECYYEWLQPLLRSHEKLRFALYQARDTMKFAGKWRCQACGAINDCDPAWRWTGAAWQHRCSDRHPQAGHADADYLGDDLGPILVLQQREIATLKEQLLTKKPARKTKAQREQEKAQHA